MHAYISYTHLETLHCVFLVYILYFTSLPNDYLADQEVFFVHFLLPNTLNPPLGGCRYSISPLSLQHTNACTPSTHPHRRAHSHKHTHCRLHRIINWIPSLFTQCLSAGYRQGSPVYEGMGFMVSLTVSNKHFSICAAGSKQQESCFRS